MSIIDTVLNCLMRVRVRGAARLVRFVRGNNPVPLTRCRTRDGLTVLIDSTSYMDGQVLRSGYFEPEVMDAILEHLGPDEVLWDIGANIGLHAVTAKHHRPAARIYAFEPVPLMASRAITNAELNGLDVVVLPFALGAAPGYAQLNVQILGNPGISTFRPLAARTYETKLHVRVERADALFDQIPPPDVIKIDVEGFEPEVFLGFGGDLERVKAIIFEELETDSGGAAMLRAAGFDVKNLPLADGQPGTNFIATRQNRGA